MPVHSFHPPAGLRTRQPTFFAPTAFSLGANAAETDNDMDCDNYSVHSDDIEIQEDEEVVTTAIPPTPVIEMSLTPASQQPLVRDLVAVRLPPISLQVDAAAAAGVTASTLTTAAPVPTVPQKQSNLTSIRRPRSTTPPAQAIYAFLWAVQTDPVASRTTEQRVAHYSYILGPDLEKLSPNTHSRTMYKWRADFMALVRMRGTTFRTLMLRLYTLNAFPHFASYTKRRTSQELSLLMFYAAEKEAVARESSAPVAAATSTATKYPFDVNAVETWSTNMQRQPPRKSVLLDTPPALIYKFLVNTFGLKYDGLHNMTEAKIKFYFGESDEAKSHRAAFGQLNRDQQRAVVRKWKLDLSAYADSCNKTYSEMLRELQLCERFPHDASLGSMFTTYENLQRMNTGSSSAQVAPSPVAAIAPSEPISINKPRPRCRRADLPSGKRRKVSTAEKDDDEDDVEYVESGTGSLERSVEILEDRLRKKRQPPKRYEPELIRGRPVFPDVPVDDSDDGDDVDVAEITHTARKTKRQCSLYAHEMLSDDEYRVDEDEENDEDDVDADEDNESVRVPASANEGADDQTDAHVAAPTPTPPPPPPAPAPQQQPTPFGQLGALVAVASELSLAQTPAPVAPAPRRIMVSFDIGPISPVHANAPPPPPPLSRSQEPSPSPSLPPMHSLSIKIPDSTVWKILHVLETVAPQYKELLYQRLAADLRARLPHVTVTASLLATLAGTWQSDLEEYARYYGLSYRVIILNRTPTQPFPRGFKAVMTRKPVV